MNAGDTFLAPAFDDHLWMVISDPRQSAQLVVVCFLSWQRHYDQSCVVDAGEHPFVKHSTCVNYPGAALVADATLEALKAQGSLKLREPLSTALLGKIRKSAGGADIPTESYATLQRQGLVP